MRKVIGIVSLLLVLLCLTSMNQPEKDFHVTIEQSGKLIKPIDGVITLDKKEFNIVFEFSEPMGLLINGSFNKKTFELASKGAPKSELPGFQNTGMAEGLLNLDKEIFISNNSPNYWFYDDDGKNRFNSVEKVNDKFLCKRIIQNLFDTDTKKNVKVENAKNPLYLVFISYKRSEKITDEIEVKREWIKIKWKK